MNTLSNTQKAIYGVKIQNKFRLWYHWRWRRGTKNEKAGSFLVEGQD